MNPFEELTDRLNRTAWAAPAGGYSPSQEEMQGILRLLKTLSVMVRQGEHHATQHVLASPARMLGHVPAAEVGQAIEDHAGRIADAYAKVLVKNALEWADMVTEGKLPPGYSPDIFEPVLDLLERGCHFRLSKGFLEVGDKAIPVQRWPMLSAA